MAIAARMDRQLAHTLRNVLWGALFVLLAVLMFPFVVLYALFRLGNMLAGESAGEQAETPRSEMPTSAPPAPAT